MSARRTISLSTSRRRRKFAPGAVTTESSSGSQGGPWASPSPKRSAMMSTVLSHVSSKPKAQSKAGLSGNKCMSCSTISVIQTGAASCSSPASAPPWASPLPAPSSWRGRRPRRAICRRCPVLSASPGRSPQVSSAPSAAPSRARLAATLVTPWVRATVSAKRRWCAAGSTCFNVLAAKPAAERRKTFELWEGSAPPPREPKLPTTVLTPCVGAHSPAPRSVPSEAARVFRPPPLRLPPRLPTALGAVRKAKEYGGRGKTKKLVSG
mmetsp:Transcript_113664/g.361100  ORF Transcript_113664/g.361100 Transcript_113664/m.361100 type:complete len:266 (+) Transcript_113664:5988-6785(+)